MYAMGFTCTNARTMSSARVVKSRQSPVDNRRSMEVSITCRINTTKIFAVSFQILLTERPCKPCSPIFQILCDLMFLPWTLAKKNTTMVWHDHSPFGLS